MPYSNELFGADFWFNLLYETLDAVAIAVPEEAEAVATVVAKLIKLVVNTVRSYYKTKAENEEILKKNKSIIFMLDQLQQARIHVDTLKSLVGEYPELATKIADIKVPKVPGSTSRKISDNIEFLIYKQMLKRKEANYNSSNLGGLIFFEFDENTRTWTDGVFGDMPNRVRFHNSGGEDRRTYFKLPEFGTEILCYQDTSTLNRTSLKNPDAFWQDKLQNTPEKIIHLNWQDGKFVIEEPESKRQSGGGGMP